MSATQQTKEMIMELMKDKKIHTIQEFNQMVAEKGIVTNKNSCIVHNVLFRLKKDGYIESTGITGEYILGTPGGKQSQTGAKPEEEKTAKAVPTEEKPRTSKPINLNMDKYMLLSPQNTKYQELKISVFEMGELRMNAALTNAIKNKKIEIFLSKDYRSIILNPDGPNAHEFTKAGTVKNREIVTLLKKLRIPFPIVYLVTWNEELSAWEGKLNVSAKV